MISTHTIHHILLLSANAPFPSRDQKTSPWRSQAQTNGDLGTRTACRQSNWLSPYMKKKWSASKILCINHLLYEKTRLKTKWVRALEELPRRLPKIPDLRLVRAVCVCVCEATYYMDF